MVDPSVLGLSYKITKDLNGIDRKSLIDKNVKHG
jgi:hypothetical protein